MKKFLSIIAIYILIISLIVIIVNYVYICNGGNIYSDTLKFDYIPEGIEICNLGSSHGVYGYDYEDLTDEYVCFNMALDSQSLSYDMRVLEAYKDYLAPGGILIIDISYFACFGYPEETGKNFESKQKRYYHILPPKLIKNYSLYTDIIVDKMPALDVGISGVVNVIMNPVIIDSGIDFYPMTYAYKTVNTEELRQDVIDACYRHIFSNKRDESGELFYNEEEIEALYNIIKICHEIGVKPILVTVPYLKEYTDEIKIEDPDFYDIFYGWIDSVKSELGVDYFDYSMDERFIYDYGLFFNCDHMNIYGARKFTDVLFEEVIRERL